MDPIVWALVHANTPGSVNESANDLYNRVMSMRCSAGSADALEYWGYQLLHTHERSNLALDECALALAMSQHAKLGRESRAAELDADLLESIFGFVRADARAVAAGAREALCALWTCCIQPWRSVSQRQRAQWRVLHFLEAHAQDNMHFARARDALEDFCRVCFCNSCVHSAGGVVRAGAESQDTDSAFRRMSVRGV
ncbi:MAG: hypothetical protein EBR51_00055 [Gammaproteobacteria bacterium]|jgi:hypothetical protein|nr:hypothetical protein [Gammaproteobacteria bacterium]